jgi:hypothetical protein
MLELRPAVIIAISRRIHPMFGRRAPGRKNRQHGQ